MNKISSFQIWCLPIGWGHVYHGVASPLLFKIVWRRLEGSIYCSKNLIYLSAFIVPSKTYKAAHNVFTYAPPCHQRCWLLNWPLITRWKVSLLFNSGGHSVRDFQQECQIWTRLIIEHFSTLKQSILNEAWPKGHDGASGPCSQIASFWHDGALVGICRWNRGLCLSTMVSGSIPGPI